MKRLFWTAVGVGLGAASGIAAARKLRQAQDALTPSSMAGAFAGAVGNLGEAIKDFAAEVREGMSEREHDLTDALGLGDPDPDEPGAAR
ncbi:MAG: hypothetical protein ABI912_04560 [Actinomycetota bacterium]